MNNRTSRYNCIISFLQALFLQVNVPASAQPPEGSSQVFFVSDRASPNLKVGAPNKLQNSVGQFISVATAVVPSNFQSNKIQVHMENSMFMNYGAGGENASPWTYSLVQSPSFVSFTNREDVKNAEQIIVFVHGCCIRERDALVEAARLQKALGAPVVMFDWSTPNKTSLPIPEYNAYRKSERSLEISEPNFANCMDFLQSQFPNKKFVLVAHSMGNRIVKQFLLQSHHAAAPKVETVHMVFPDLSIAGFALQEQQLSKAYSKCYVYMDDDDQWLQLSKCLSGGIERLGQPGMFFHSAERNGGNFVIPENRFFLDVTQLKMHHSIPFNLLATVQKQGIVTSDHVFNFDLKDENSEHRQFRRVSYEKSESKHLIENTEL